MLPSPPSSYHDYDHLHHQGEIIKFWKVWEVLEIWYQHYIAAFYVPVMPHSPGCWRKLHEVMPLLLFSTVQSQKPFLSLSWRRIHSLGITSSAKVFLVSSSREKLNILPNPYAFIAFFPLFSLVFMEFYYISLRPFLVCRSDI